MMQNSYVFLNFTFCYNICIYFLKKNKENTFPLDKKQIKKNYLQKGMRQEREIFKSWQNGCT